MSYLEEVASLQPVVTAAGLLLFLLGLQWELLNINLDFRQGGFLKAIYKEERVMQALVDTCHIRGAKAQLD